MNIADAMTRTVELIDPNTTVETAARMMRDDDVGALPVGENDRLVGMVTDRDIAVRGVADSKGVGTTVRDVMSEGVNYCFEDESLARAAEVMSEHQIRRLPVLNREKRLVGMVSLADLARVEPTPAKDALSGVSEASSAARH